jgi:hypothetical protein
MSILLIVFILTNNGVKSEVISEPTMKSCELFAAELNSMANMKADCVEVSND